MEEVQAKLTVYEDNDRVRVNEWRFAPGTATGQHKHEYDYVVVPMTTGRLMIVDSDGERANDIVVGSPYYRDGGAEHNVINRTDQEVVFIEIEMK